MDYLETKLEAAEKERDEYKKWWLHVVVEKGEQSDKLHTATTLLSTMAGALEGYLFDKRDDGVAKRDVDVLFEALAAYKEWGK